ncbi:FepA family TonB-dependent siderophore receptor [Pseudomonas sp. S 311-6]|nr:FepA family TonB-dependent siderophore receptor [Pseudomonas sp. S 311-6]
MDNFYRLASRSVLVPCLLGGAIHSAWAQSGNLEPSASVTTLDDILVTAAGDQLKQAPGASIITADQIDRFPVTNDISEVIRQQPGVNLTGNSSTGSRGNNRQIDIRGMGPENTLILIDGKPVLSRNSVRFGVGGERDTRGDSNWVPAEAIESIEVLRGPAAARYGSGAAGGVVNIRTKPATEHALAFTTFFNLPEDSNEGSTRRVTALASGPVNDLLSYRVYGDFNDTDNDKLGVNGTPSFDGRAYNFQAGREGVRNRDVSARLSLQANPDHRIDLDLGWSRQGNKFAGDSANSYIFADPSDPAAIDGNYAAMVGKETNRMTRTTVSVSHTGQYGFGRSDSYVQFERTENKRLAEGLGGALEGTILTGDNSSWNKTTLNNITAKSEFNVPWRTGFEQMLTAGVEFRRESLNDPGSINVDLPDGLSPGGIPLGAADRSTHASSHLAGVYVEDNVYLGETVIVTPGLRFDHHSKFGRNASPSLNVSWEATPEISIKGGVARAYKAPNLYQTNPNYAYNSLGYGCWQGVGPCYIVGNPDLKPEISLNKEIGVMFRNDEGWVAGMTYFHNRYRNRIGAGQTVLASAAGAPICYTPWYCMPTNNIAQQWENSGPATIAGLEGNFTVPLARTLEWSGNFTYMSKSEDDRGEPLSLVPKYTLNAWLDWQAAARIAVNLGITRYGKIHARGTDLLTGAASASTDSREAYTLVNFGVKYQINKAFRINTGIKNLFDKQLQRSGLGANTFNEPGRSYYLSLSGSF